MSRLDLIHAMTWTTTSSGTTNHPETTAYVPRPGLLVGGGAYTPTPDQYLVSSSFTQDRHGWTVQSKDHITGAPGRVVATAIGIAPCPTRYTGGCLSSGAVGGGSLALGGYDYADVGIGGAALVSIGGVATYNGAGRMLADLFPALLSNPPTPIFVLRTKDHLYSDSGTTTGWIVGLSKAP